MRQDILNKIERNTLRLKASHRGGGVEIDLTEYGFAGERMSAYQNYLGGGMLGSIQVNNTINAFGKYVSSTKQDKLDRIGKNLMKYFHMLTNHSATFEENQLRPSSAY